MNMSLQNGLFLLMQMDGWMIFPEMEERNKAVTNPRPAQRWFNSCQQHSETNSQISRQSSLSLLAGWILEHVLQCITYFSPFVLPPGLQGSAW
jgi:hypothetical protein